MPDDFDLPQGVAQPADLAARAARGAGLGFLVLLGVVGAVFFYRRHR